MSAAVATVAATFYVSAARSACLAEAGVAQNRRKQRRRTSPTNPRLAKNFCSAVTLPPLFRKPLTPQTHPARTPPPTRPPHKPIQREAPPQSTRHQKPPSF